MKNGKLPTYKQGHKAMIQRLSLDCKNKQIKKICTREKSQKTTRYIRKIGLFIVYTFDKIKHKFDFTDWAIFSINK